MKKFLKYTVLGFGIIILASILAPMIAGFLVGAAIALGGFWLYERSESSIMRLLGITVIGSGIMVALGSAPVLLLVAVPAVGYVAYKLWKNGDVKTASDNPFDNFEAEWNKLSK
ncbi:MAG: hypothetical protein ACI33P_15070 [Lysinibacillus sp.]